MSKFIIGLTGGIGSGKTAVSSIFQQLGITVVDADVCSRIVVEKRSPALEKITQHFGKAILLPDGTLDRAQLRSIIFKDTLKREWLEKLLHPLIHTEITRQLAAAASPYAILVSPLLAETGQKNLCHRMLVVDSHEEEQINRTMSRDKNSREQVEAIMKTQASRTQRQQIADDVIHNNDSLESLHQKVATLHRQYLELASNFTDQ